MTRGGSTTTSVTFDGDDDTLRQALLSPSTPFEPTRLPPAYENVGSPNSFLAGNVEESPNLSFMETSFFSHLRALRPSPRQEENEGEDSDVGDVINDDESIPNFVKCLDNGLFRYNSILLIALCAVLWPIGCYSFLQFQKNTDSTFHPIPGTLSRAAQDAFAEIYENDYNDPMNPALIVILESTTNQSLIDSTSPSYSEARNFSLSLLPELNSRCWNDPDNDTCTQQRDWLKVTSFYTFEDDDLHWMASALATADGQSTFLQVQYLLPSNKGHKQRVKELREAIEQYSANHTSDRFYVRFTGLNWFQSDLVQSSKHDLANMDMLVLPLALILLGVVLPHANPLAVWIIPLVTMISTVCVWSIIMCHVVTLMQITQFTPTVMMSLSLGMGIDYTMFLLARFLEDTATPRRVSVVRTITKGGHVLLLSGLTLMCTFLGLCFLPLPMLISVGVGAAVAIGSALFINLTVVPALLYTRIGDWIVKGDAATPLATSHHLQQQDETNQNTPDSVLHSRIRSIQIHRPLAVPDSIWHRLSKQLLHPYKGIIILLVTCQVLFPVIWYSTQVKSSLSFDLLLPYTSPALKAYHSLGTKIGQGRMNPYRILFDGRAAGLHMTSEVGFNVMHRVVDELIAMEKTMDSSDHSITTTTAIRNLSADNISFSEYLISTMQQLHEIRSGGYAVRQDDYLALTQSPRTTAYNGIAVLRNTHIPYSFFITAQYCAQVEPHCPVEPLHVLSELDKLSTSKDRKATFLTVTLKSRPFSDEGIEWLINARATVDHLEKSGELNGVQVHIQGSASIAFDAVHAVYSAFPTMITVTILVIFVLMGIFFKSIFAPLRSIASIALTLGFSFGLAVLVFERGFMDWTNVRAFMTSTGDDMCWLVPIMAFSIIVGLALDYDVFLSSRILEYRLEGYEHKTSIASGLHATGGIITAAGIIMAFAFGSLMLSSNPVLFEWSFLLTTAVLLDTFVIRSLVVPAVTGLTGERYCWWPRQLPEPTVCISDYQEHSSDDVVAILRSLEEHSEYEPVLTSPR